MKIHARAFYHVRNLAKSLIKKGKVFTSLVAHLPELNPVYYIDTDEIPGFFLLLKNISSSCAVKIPFLSFTCEDIGVAMVTNMISQLQESFPLRNFEF